MKKVLVFSTVVCMFNFSMYAYATQFSVEFKEYGRLHWTGTVDTETDDLTIDFWQADFYYWNPQTPMVWSATDSDLQPYDVPDNWDGTIGNWGFISPISNYYTIWEEGPVDSGYRQHRLYMGWGAGNVYDFGIGFYQLPEDVNRNWTYLVLVGPHTAGDPSVPDEISVTEIPEPATLSLLALGAMLAGRRRKV